MHAVIFASPDFGAAGNAAFVLQLLTLPLAIVGTIVVVWGFYFLIKRKNAGTDWLAILVSALVSAFVAFVVALVEMFSWRGLRDDPSWIPSIVGSLCGLVVGLLILCAPDACLPTAREPEQKNSAPATHDEDEHSHAITDGATRGRIPKTETGIIEDNRGEKPRTEPPAEDVQE